MKNIIIGTAGHIDHGKTTLIKALTGRNSWETDPFLREFGSLGKPRRISDEFRPHGPCPPNRFAPEQGMGNIHGRRYQEIKRRTGKSSIHVMG